MKGHPIILVTCDECGEEIEIELTAIARKGYDERYVDHDLEHQGWICDGFHDFCSTECEKAYQSIK